MTSRTSSLTAWDVTDTLEAYIDKYSNLVSYLADDATSGAVPPSDPAPPDLTSKAISLRVRRPFLIPFLVSLTLVAASFRLASSSTAREQARSLGRSWSMYLKGRRSKLAKPFRHNLLGLILGYATTARCDHAHLLADTDYYYRII